MLHAGRWGPRSWAMGECCGTPERTGGTSLEVYVECEGGEQNFGQGIRDADGESNCRLWLKTDSGCYVTQYDLNEYEGNCASSLLCTFSPTLDTHLSTHLTLSTIETSEKNADEMTSRGRGPRVLRPPIRRAAPHPRRRNPALQNRMHHLPLAHLRHHLVPARRHGSHVDVLDGSGDACHGRSVR